MNIQEELNEAHQREAQTTTDHFEDEKEHSPLFTSCCGYEVSPNSIHIDYGRCPECREGCDFEPCEDNE